MNKITIFRVQDKDGRGPFKPGFSHKWVCGRRDHKNLMPWILEFGPVHEKICTFEHAGCGCRTIKQLQRWFTKKEFRILQKYGYGAVKMEIGRILAESDIQCVFARIKPLNVEFSKVRLY